MSGGKYHPILTSYQLRHKLQKGAKAKRISNMKRSIYGSFWSKTSVISSQYLEALKLRNAYERDFRHFCLRPLQEETQKSCLIPTLNYVIKNFL